MPGASVHEGKPRRHRPGTFETWWVSCRLAGWTGDFADEINDQLALAATDAQIYRAAARVEARIECLLDDWDDVRSVKPHPPDERGWKLLVGTYRDLAEQVQGWLDEILEDPAAAVERRGLAD